MLKQVQHDGSITAKIALNTYNRNDVGHNCRSFTYCNAKMLTENCQMQLIWALPKLRKGRAFQGFASLRYRWRIGTETLTIPNADPSQF